MRQPAATLPFVDAEALETELHALGEGRRSAARIVEDEHADRACLAVAHGCQQERLGCSCLPAEHGHDPLELAARPRAEESEGDVEALDGSSARKVLLAPGHKLDDDVLRELEREEEPDPVIG